MRVVLIGGTQFIGRRVVELLAARGDEVLVVHRGRAEPERPVGTHLHVDRAAFATVAAEVRGFRPDAVVDTCALSRADTDAVLPHLPDVPLVLLSSMDTYRVFELLIGDSDESVPVPVTERDEVRRHRFPHRDRMPDYDKLDVEPGYLARGGTALRLAMIYGPHDPQRREEPVLRRVRAGRRRIPTGPGTTLLTRLHVDDAATAVLAALDRPAAVAGRILNIGESRSLTVRGWLHAILDAAGHDAELVPVPVDRLPPDLSLTRDHAQHLLVSSATAMRLLDWTPGDPVTGVHRSVRWHLDHPPHGPDPDFTADDAALRAASP